MTTFSSNMPLPDIQKIAMAPIPAARGRAIFSFRIAIEVNTYN